MEIKTVDYGSPDAPREFVTSLHETGFAVLKNHPIPAQLLNSIYRGWGAFFAGDEKLEFKLPEDPRLQDAPAGATVKYRYQRDEEGESRTELISVGTSA